jgi:hypothetical protein
MLIQRGYPKMGIVSFLLIISIKVNGNVNDMLTY